MKQFTHDEAITFYTSGAWQALDLMDRARLQLEQRRLCMPVAQFHAAMEFALGRPVWTHEFAQLDSLRDEFYERIPKATWAEIVAKIPAHMPLLFLHVPDARKEPKA